MCSWPSDVGIVALEIIFPSQYVSQSELEKYEGVSEGKYTIGLGQHGMGFCSDREDINSLCLTVVHKLMDRYNIKPSEIGRLEVGTETIIDKSKSVKSVLMQLFEPHGVTDIEGIDTTNACYGGTAALFNSLAWIESSAWDGRYALVVAADIAVYAKGSARPTGGAGAVAILLGPNAPLVFDRGFRSTCIRHAYDFYKPDLTSEYPVVDGKLSIQCYLNALDTCYKLYCEKREKKLNEVVNLNSFEAVLFHSPYCKLVQKSLARLKLIDFLRSSKELRNQLYSGLEKFNDIKLENSYFDKDVEKEFLKFSNDEFVQKTKPSLLLASQVGNMYTPSLYGGLVSLLMKKDISQIVGNKVLFFSYGSGLAASVFSMTITKNSKDETLNKIISNLKYNNSLLQKRLKVDPKTFEDCLELRKDSCHKAPYVPVGSIQHFFPGTYYLVKIDDKFRRSYERTPVGEAGYV